MVPEGGFEPPTRGFSILLKAPFSAPLIVNHAENSPNRIKGLQNDCKPTNAQIVAELNYARCLFQLEAIRTAMGVQNDASCADKA